MSAAKSDSNSLDSKFRNAVSISRELSVFDNADALTLKFWFIWYEALTPNSLFGYWILFCESMTVADAKPFIDKGSACSIASRSNDANSPNTKAGINLKVSMVVTY